MRTTQSHDYAIREIELLFPGAKSTREKLSIDDFRDKTKSVIIM